MSSTRKNTVTAILLAFSIGLVVSYVNYRNLWQSLLAALVLALVAGVLVAILSWAIDYARRKGYPGWLGFILVLILNVFGILILIVLPTRRRIDDRGPA